MPCERVAVCAGAAQREARKAPDRKTKVALAMLFSGVKARAFRPVYGVATMKNQAGAG